MNPKKLSLTIAIPTYNRAQKVSVLARSVLDQLQSGEELLIIDDGSPDNTYDLLSAMHGVRVHRQLPNQGMVKTWNACLQLASSDWICIIHDDDILCEGALQAIRSACLIAGEPALIIHTPTVKGKASKLIYKILSSGPSAVFCSATGTVPSGAVVHKQIVESLGGFDEELAYSSDIEYFARINTQYKLMVIEAPMIVDFQLHSDNYQYKTWLKQDFYSQLLEIERRVILYSGLDGAEATFQFNKRIVGYLTYITERSTQLGIRVLMRKFGLLLWRASGAGRRDRLKGLTTLLKSWTPIF